MMHRIVATTPEFLNNWDSRVNFLMLGECVPFSFEFPPTEQIVERLVAEQETTGITGRLRATSDRGNTMAEFRGMSFADLLATSFQLRYPDVTILDRPGDLFAGFTERVLIPWKRYLQDHDFEWDRCYALARVSGPNTCTGYHMDRSNVLFWNVRGRKIFNGFQDPDRWVSLEQVSIGREAQVMPGNVLDEDVLSYEVADNAFLWNHLLTPHWVDATELTFGINFSHGGLRRNGRLCRYEQYLYDTLGHNPNGHWRPETASVVRAAGFK